MKIESSLRLIDSLSVDPVITMVFYAICCPMIGDDLTFDKKDE
jgi:hypothetical protein